MKRCMSICCVFAMALGLSFGVSTDTQAASSVKVIDGSKLTTDAESIGYNQKSCQRRRSSDRIFKNCPDARDKSMPEEQR